ncbi:MAG: DNA topoisomerase IV subunit A, partial [Candidatus Bathyarchaeia archaeon]
MKKKVKSSAAEKRKEVLKGLKKMGRSLYGQMEKGKFPWIKMPSRSTQNIFYSPEVRQYVLGDKRVRRSSR